MMLMMMENKSSCFDRTREDQGCSLKLGEDFTSKPISDLHNLKKIIFDYNNFVIKSKFLADWRLF